MNKKANDMRQRIASLLGETIGIKVEFIESNSVLIIENAHNFIEKDYLMSNNRINFIVYQSGCV